MAPEATPAPAGNMVKTPDQDAVAEDARSAETFQYITFTIGDEEYGVDIMAVREIKGWSEPTVLPNTPAHMRGVLNVRGEIVPIFDLRCRFDQGRTEATNIHVIVIIAIADRLAGMLVDAVSDIISIGREDFKSVPKMDRQIDTEYLSGLATVKDRMVALLDAEKLFSMREVENGILAGANTPLLQAEA